MNHYRLVFLGDAVESFLNNVATKGIHAESKRVTTDFVGDGDDLLLCAVFEAALDQEVTEAIDHQFIGLGNDGLYDLILLFWRAHFELLLEEDRGLLVVVADDLIHDVLPVAVHVAIQ